MQQDDRFQESDSNLMGNHNDSGGSLQQYEAVEHSMVGNAENNPTMVGNDGDLPFGIAALKKLLNTLIC